MHIINTTQPFFTETQKTEFNKNVLDIFDSKRLILGRYTMRLEESFSAFYLSSGAALLNSASSSLILLLKYLNSSLGNVIIPSLNCISVANAVEFSGGKANLCDVSKDELFPSLNQIIEVEDSNTKGIIIIDIAGERNPYFSEIVEYAKEKDFFIILDSSHSPGLLANQEKLYSKVDAQVFSLYPTKILSSAAGGVVLSNNNQLINYLKSARHHGENISLEDCDKLSGGFYLSEFDAALGVVMFNSLSKIIDERKFIADLYNTEVAKISGIRALANSESVYYKYQILCSTKSQRENIKTYLHDKGVRTGAVYNPPIHLKPQFKGKEKCSLKNSEDIASRILALPMYNGMDPNDLEIVIEAIKGISAL
jgi:dTDP-4-amino-4,6-dideoxygalactose transaminase